VEKSGAWFSAEGERIGQGRDNAKQYLKDNPAMLAVLEGKIRANAGLVAEAMLVGPADAIEAAEAVEDAPPADNDDAPAAKSSKSKKAS